MLSGRSRAIPPRIKMKAMIELMHEQHAMPQCQDVRSFVRSSVHSSGMSPCSPVQSAARAARASGAHAHTQSHARMHTRTCMSRRVRACMYVCVCVRFRLRLRALTGVCVGTCGVPANFAGEMC